MNYLLTSTGIDNKYYNIILNNDSLKNYLFSSSNIVYYNKGDISLWSIMCGTFSSVKDIKIYNQLPFYTGIYDYINQIFYKGEKSIETIKKGIMNFHNLQKYRKKSPVVKEMVNTFPSVNNIIEQINNLSKNKGYLFILLQRAESYLLLQTGAQKLLERIPNLKFFTVHDSLVVPEDQAESVSKILSDSIYKFTGIEIGLKIKRTNPFKNIEETSSEIWKKSLKSLNLN